MPGAAKTLITYIPCRADAGRKTAERTAGRTRHELIGQRM
jgi:hypothetical protein